uniref:Uncharacterized protein n=1 Tax=Glossina palpalis gambiensis TaxID=67801 RepID=A0A1B0AYF5_9MUSC
MKKFMLQTKYAYIRPYRILMFSKQNHHPAYRHAENIYDGGTDTDDDECPLESSTTMNPASQLENGLNSAIAYLKETKRRQLIEDSEHCCKTWCKCSQI